MINYRSESVAILFRDLGKQCNKIADKNIPLLTISLKWIATHNYKRAVGREAHSEAVRADRRVTRTA